MWIGRKRQPYRRTTRRLDWPLILIRVGIGKQAHHSRDPSRIAFFIVSTVLLRGWIRGEIAQSLQLRLQLRRSQWLAVIRHQSSDAALVCFHNFLGRVSIPGFLSQQISHRRSMTVGIFELVFDRGLHQRMWVSFCQPPRG